MAGGKHGKQQAQSGWMEQIVALFSSRLSVMIGIGCACSCIYVFLLLVSSNPYWTYGSPHCDDEACEFRKATRGGRLTGRLSVEALSSLILVNESSEAEIRQIRSVSEEFRQTSIDRIVFGIGASADLWTNRSQFLKVWWKPETRGYIWTERDLGSNWTVGDPPYRVSEDISHFKYTHRRGRKAAIRISRVVSESFRLGSPDVDWFVMGDDDTFFFTENLVKVLSKYDHRKRWYIGSNSEDHIQNQLFSYSMAYGGGGFAISYALAKELSEIQDECMERYSWLFGSDDRMKACMSELGVPLTKEPGFHQVDLRGDLSGFLTAHPVAPILSLHHLEAIHSLFPGKKRVQSLKTLQKAINVDPHNILQQSICYDSEKQWSFSVSWGYVIHVYKGFVPPHELEVPMLTFMSWHKRRESYAFPLNTRSRAKEICDEPAPYYLFDVKVLNETFRYSAYEKLERPNRVRGCHEKLLPLSLVDKIFVESEPVEEDWFQNPRRQCCRVKSINPDHINIHMGPCQQGERAVM